ILMVRDHRVSCRDQSGTSEQGECRTASSDLRYASRMKAESSKPRAMASGGPHVDVERERRDMARGVCDIRRFLPDLQRRDEAAVLTRLPADSESREGGSML